MTKFIEGNAIDYVLEGDRRILLHCCNAQRKMNSGLAKEVRQRIPDAYRAYMEGCTLGEVTYDCRAKAANMVAQEYYGYDGKRYVDYGMLAKCLIQVKQDLPFEEYVIPYKMASDRAGGDWDTVLELCRGILGGNITVVEYVGGGK